MIDQATAARIAEILVVECGANAEHLKSYGFESYVTTAKRVEFRFQGRLGFGGKFHASPGLNGDRWYVTCYAEDANPKRLHLIDNANTRLAELQEEVNRKVET